MTKDIAPEMRKIKLFLTDPHPCSYLSEQSATTAFVDPQQPICTETYSRLSASGFRRSGQYIYTPHCMSCNACIPVRVLADTFKPTRSQKRCLKRNSDITVDVKHSIDLDEHYELYQRYIDTRHCDGDMYPATPEQYHDFIGKPWESTRFIEYRLEQELIACAVSDWLSDGLSAVYTYFDPTKPSRSLGTFAILKQIDIIRAQVTPGYVYLGYWVKKSAKMNYKSKFSPFELYAEDCWKEA